MAERPTGALRPFGRNYNDHRQSRGHSYCNILAFGIAMPAKADLIKELIPTGKFRGVTVDLGAALARKLGVPVEFIPHLASARSRIQRRAENGT
jgi:hypothetical protein